MFEHILKDAVQASGVATTVAVVVAIVVAISLAGCGGGERAEKSAAKTPSIIDGVDLSAKAAEEGRNELVLAARSESSKPVQSALVESRHFAMYNTYREVFDGAPDRFLSGAHDPGDVLLNKFSALDGKRIGAAISSCSARALITQD